MKKTIALMLLAFSLFAGCSKDDDAKQDSQAVTFGQKEFTFGKEGGDLKVSLSNAPMKPELEYLDDTNDWIIYSMSGTGTLPSQRVFYFSVTENESYEADRLGRIVFRNGTQVDTVTVYQTGGHPIVFVGQDTLRVNAKGGVVTSVVNSNFNFDCIIPQEVTWITRTEPAATRGVVKSSEVSFMVEPNTGDADRVAEIYYKDPQTNVYDTLTVLQGVRMADADSYVIDEKARNIQLNLKAGLSVKATANVKWLTVSNNGTITVKSLPKDSLERNTVVTVENLDNHVVEKVEIVQMRAIRVMADTTDIDTLRLLPAKSFQLSMKAASIVGEQPITWVSSDTSIVKVSETGIVTSADTLGTAFVKAVSAEGYADSCRVEVVKAKDLVDFSFSGSYSQSGTSTSNEVECTIANNSNYTITLTKAYYFTSETDSTSVGSFGRNGKAVAPKTSSTINFKAKVLHPRMLWVFTCDKQTYQVYVKEEGSAIIKE